MFSLDCKRLPARNFKNASRFKRQTLGLDAFKNHPIPRNFPEQFQMLMLNHLLYLSMDKMEFTLKDLRTCYGIFVIQFTSVMHLGD